MLYQEKLQHDKYDKNSESANQLKSKLMGEINNLMRTLIAELPRDLEHVWY